jgi:hypothetical protein
MHAPDMQRAMQSESQNRLWVQGNVRDYSSNVTELTGFDYYLNYITLLLVEIAFSSFLITKNAITHMYN